MDEHSEANEGAPDGADDRWGRAARTIGVMVDGLVEFYYEYVVDLRFAPWPIVIDTKRQTRILVKLILQLHSL